MPLAPEFVEAVADNNLKAIGEVPALAQNMNSQNASFANGRAMENAVQLQHGMGTIFTSLVGAIGKRLVELDPSEALSVVKTATGNDPALAGMTLLSSLGFGQQAAKSAQTTPPPTA